MTMFLTQREDLIVEQATGKVIKIFVCVFRFKIFVYCLNMRLPVQISTYKINQIFFHKVFGHFAFSFTISFGQAQNINLQKQTSLVKLRRSLRL